MLLDQMGSSSGMGCLVKTAAARFQACILLLELCLLASALIEAPLLINYSSEIRIGTSSVRAAGSPLVGMQAVLFTLGKKRLMYAPDECNPSFVLQAKLSKGLNAH
jgi:hypothetical protein